MSLPVVEPTRDVCSETITYRTQADDHPGPTRGTGSPGPECDPVPPDDRVEPIDIL